MTDEDYKNERRYQLAMYIARQLLKLGNITEEDYKVIDTNMRAVFNPIFGTILSDNTLTSTE